MYTKDSIHFAPMEGMTDHVYRKSIQQLYPEWDTWCTDFLRLPSVGQYKEKHFIRHFGQEQFNDELARSKTTFQVLTSPQSYTKESIKTLSKLGFQKIDLNIGCPSRTVNNHKGGAYLLEDRENLKVILNEIRQNFDGFFSVKMRLGYRSTEDLIPCLKLIQESCADMIILHGRTRDQLYKGIACWNQIKKAIDLCPVPIIGNGDIWSLQDINNIKVKTDCHGIMMARGALKTPWMARLYKSGKKYSQFELNQIRKKEIPIYYSTIYENAMSNFPNEKIALKKLKSLSRYLFEDFENGQNLRSKIMRSQTYKEFSNNLNAALSEV